MNQTPIDPVSTYGKEYYDTMCEVPYEREQPVWRKHFLTLARTLANRYQPKTVLDVGCAKGFLVENLRDLGVEASGVDVSPYAISQVREDIRPFCRAAAGTEPIEGTFDLITCIEVAEHMPEADAKAMIKEICRHTDQIIFSSSPDDTEEPTHINLHPAEYWIELFREQGFFPDYCFEPGFITPQAMRFLRAKKQKLEVAIFSHEPPNCAVALLRLAGIVRHLERQNRMGLHWCTARDPQVAADELINSDLFVLHREFCDRRISPQILAAARELNKPVVFELDDLLINVPESNPNHKYCKSITPDVLEMMRQADYITVTTEPLRRYLEEAEPQARGKIHVLPNYINLDIWDGAKPPAEKPSDPFVIGWFGTATHDEDLAIIKPAIVKLARKHAGRLVFKFWGYLPKDLEGIPGVELVRGSQPDLRLHARDLVNCRIDLALAPLLDHPFNHAKSDLKWLEYSICQIPGIYSTISPYTASVTHGKTGWLVDNDPAVWQEAIERFMSDDNLRRSIATQAYEEVRRTRCVDTGSEKWDALYRSFVAGGTRPRAAIEETVEAKAHRAAAHIMLFQSEVFSNKGQTKDATGFADAAMARYLLSDSASGSFLKNSVERYQTALKDTQQNNDLAARFKAGRIVAEAGLKEEAVKIYLEVLEFTQKSNNPITVLKTMLEVASAFRTLDPQRGRGLLDLSAQLAGSLKMKDGLEIVEKLRQAYAQTPEPPKTANGKKSKSSPAPQPTKPPQKPAQGPLVSIVIPVFNRLELTRDCLKALREKTSGNYEVIVVNNASTDGTAEFLNEQEKAGAIRHIRNSENTGFAQACNQGAQAARGSLLLFLNNDTQVTPNWLGAMAQAAQRPQIGVVGAKLLYANNRIQHAGIGFINGIPDHPHRNAAADAPEVNKFRELDMVTGACLMIHRDLYLKLGGFDEIFRNGVEDIDLCLRVRAAGWKVVYEPKATVYHLEGQSEGRFNHVNENLKIFFERWGKAFDQNTHFIAPSPAKFLTATRSFLAANPTATEVQWIGSFLDAGSLSHVNRELTRALGASGNLKLNRVNCGAEISPAFKNLESDLSKAAATNAAVTVRHAWPPDWTRPKNGKLVVVQPWEFGSLPEQWVRNLESVDEVWAPSEYVRRVYVDSGAPAEKVFVVPNGVDTEKFHPQATPMLLPTTKKFKFLFVGGTIFRKGPDVLLKAYLANFTAADDVCLVIKDFGGRTVYAGQTFEARIRTAQALPNAPKILYLNDEFPPESLPGLYTACDCLVLPYRGEGYGLPVVEAMASGLPVMVTAGGATDDFVRDEFGFRIPAERKIFGAEISGMKLVKPGWLLEPDAAALGERMKWMAAHPDEARQRGELARQHAKQFCSWNHAAEIARRRIEALAVTRTEVPAPRKRAAIVLPTCALVGHLGKACELAHQKKFPAAWEATLTAIGQRPFHPEAYLMLAEIAAAVGDGQDAKLCAEHARRLAPELKSARKFLNQRLKGDKRPEWLKLPEEVQSLKSKVQSRLSVCLIVKNEERFIAQCLKSVREVAQQIILVDTGSTDRTVEIAKELGAEVHSFTWCDDFSAARNAALEHATGDWVLALDADEELSPKDHEKLRQAMSDAATMAWRLPIIDVGRELDGCSHVPRLFRNAPGLFYLGRVHEQIFSSIEVRRAEWGLENKIGDAALIHHGYTKEVVRDRNKVERNLRLLEQAVEELPDEPHLLMNLGLELSRSGRETEALARYREAFESMSAKPAAEVVPELRESLLTQYCSRLTAGKQFEEIARVLTSPLAKGRASLTASLHFSLGLAHFELRRFREAADQMRQCLAKRGERCLSPINRDILSAGPHHCLAMSLAHTGEMAEAEKAFEAGLKELGHVDSLRLDYARFLASQKRFVDALHQLNAIVTHDARNIAAWRLGGHIALSQPEFLEFARDWTGEAARHVPEDLVVIAQRAEALMLSEDIGTAKPLWAKAWQNERQPQALAALVLCEAIAGPMTHRPEDNKEEIAASRSFIEWYRKLFAARAQKTLTLLMERMNTVDGVLPSAAKTLGAAMAEAKQEAVGV
ncbi:MAG TPA: glycosyltransferase [Verrucomicrobiae bacterium]|jgi:GT2 family glycosyltransferase/SAM-dependent methyltransferase|nr:glycosyltransferase [Verrucomicrobiae bacterium]